MVLSQISEWVSNMWEAGFSRCYFIDICSISVSKKQKYNQLIAQ